MEIVRGGTHKLRIRGEIIGKGRAGAFIDIVSRTIAVADVILKDRGFGGPADMQPIRLISVHRVVPNLRASTSVDDYRNLLRPRGASHDIGGYEY